MDKHFLKIIILIGLVMSNVRTSVCKNNYTLQNVHVVIVGAGAAGIAAASKLFENGFTNVTILEAEDRIGGRIHTTKLGDYNVDLGGQYVHGQKGNVVYELAYPLGLLDKKDKPTLESGIKIFDSLGNLISNNLTQQLSDFFSQYLFNLELDDNSIYESIADYGEKKFRQVFRNNQEIGRDKEKYLRLLETIRIAADSTESWHDIPATISKDFKICPGDQVINWKQRGFSTVFDILMKRFPHPENELPVMNNTKLNSEVISIDYSDKAEPSVSITTTNGQLYEADHVIVTVSLGVLKEKESLFTPPLPKYKTKALKGFGYGNTAKIYLLFDKPFWDVSNNVIRHLTFMWNDAERAAIESQPEKIWLLGMYGGVTVKHKPNILVLKVSGKYSKIMEALPEEKVFHHVVENLHRFLNKHYTVTTPIAMLRSQWYTNPHFRGTYSYRSVETQKQELEREILERPITSKNLKVLFAGEATSTTRFATVDGAIDSGWKAADKLINLYKNGY